MQGSMSGFAPLPLCLPSVSDAESQHPPAECNQALGPGGTREKTTFGAGFP